MKKKNLFKESRFVWFADDKPADKPEEAPEAEAKSPQENAVDFVKKSLFWDEGFSDEAYEQGLKTKEIKALIDAVIANSSDISKEVKLAALYKLQKIDRDIKTAKMKAEADSKAETTEKLENLRKETPVKLPDAPVMSKVAFMDVDIITERNALDRLRINVRREDEHINAQKWDPTNKAGLEQIYSACRDVEIPVDDPFYQSMFAILNNALDLNTNPHRATHAEWFLRPADHLADIATLPATGGFFGGDQYVKAYEHMLFVQGEVMAVQDKHQLETAAAQEGQDKDAFASKAVDFVKSNLSKLQKAIRERDYATAALYGVGIWAIYKAVKKFTEGKEDKYGKWLAYGAAIYAGNALLKNAGYDVLKMAGFRDPDYDVKGTPMEVMRNILASNEVAWRTTNDLDYGIVLRAADIKLTTLEELYQKSNKDGVQFIEPKEFPAFFPDLRGVSPFNKGLGEKGLKDPGMSNVKLSPSQREYVSVGKQLYKLAFAMRAIYDDTLKKDHPSYKGKSYEEILKDNTRSMGKVRHLLDAVSPYATSGRHEGLFSRKKLYEVEADIKEAFAKDSGFRLETQLGPGHYKGFLQGFPVVFVCDKDGYRVYLMNNYEGEKKPGSKYLTKIPEKGKAGREAKSKEAVEGVRKRVEELLLLVGSDDPSSSVSKTLKFDGAHWTCEVNFSAIPEFGIAARTEKSTIEINPDGKNVSITTRSGARLNLNEEMARQNPVGFILAERITSQEEFKALMVFSDSGRLDVADVDRGAHTFTLRLGKANISAKIKFNGTKFEFLNPLDEAALIQHKSFGKEYVDALRSDPHLEFNKIGEELKALIKKSCPEGFLKFFFKSLAGQTMRGELGGFNSDVVSGSIPDNFTSMVIDSSRDAAFSKLQNAMAGVSKLADVETARSDSISAIQRDLKLAYDKISAINRKKLSDSEDWTRMEFMLKVVDDINGAGTRSTNYRMAKTDMRALAYKMDLPGLMTHSDFNEKSHHAVGKLMNVFTFYTAHLDTPDLDTLKYPPKLTPPFLDPKVDPGLDGHYKLNYFEYVKDRIANEAPKSLDPSLIPDPTDIGWKIDDYKTWKAAQGSYEAVDPLDNDPALKHEQSEHLAGKHTQLDEALMKKLNHKKDTMITLCKNDLDVVELENYLHNKDMNAAIEDLGIFDIYDDGTGKITSELWTDTNRIATIAGDRKSVQERMMNDVADKFVEFVFTAKDQTTGKPRFFKNNPGILEKIKLWWYKYKYNVV